ncbi:General stress protein 13 [Rubripirellula obstinata]|uniref:General stress protein 13 n=1 Tax=Rubripirellula obstinata TaxID=406547 RepID=A0A5B1CQ51_9BACT|nr:S1 RNA-binding domain-containing protein [Rubripirellula obstinata]KAA1261760.1 General stress protein 13 [Rubripirellula obstinata]
MSVDFDAIAQRGRCDVSSLRLAQPLIEQGYSPPFLSRYRRDELGGIDEASLWALSAAIRNEQEIATRKEKLHLAWQQTPLVDPAIGHAIEKAGSVRVLARLARRLKGESSTAPSDSVRLAVRVLNPQKGDGDDFAAIAGKVESIGDAAAAVAGLDDALAHRLPDDPRIVAAAVRWLAKHAQIKIAKIHDPHLESSSEKNQKEAAALAKAETKAAPVTETAAADAPKTEDAKPAAEAVPAEETSTEKVSTEKVSTEQVSTEETPAETVPAPAEANEAVAEPAAETPATDAAVETETPKSDPPAADSTPTQPVAPAEGKTAEAKPAAKKEKKAAKKPEAKKAPKKVSPRQRRRRWLVSVLKPLQGKKFNGDKLSAFQVVMLGRALRSQVAICQFEYDAAKLVAELQRTAVGFNRVAEDKLKAVVLQNEAIIRDAAEAAWWDDLQERASARLVAVTADTLRSHVNRGAVDAKVVLSIDAVGPRTAATTIVSADGRLLHCEDLPCQLSTAQRSAAVARMGELIHSHHVDLIVISNGPARRSMMVAVGDLIKQSPEKSVRWTLAERGGADAYSSSSVADQEMRSTPRRFRSAAWLAISVLQPAQAMAKVDPLKLRLSSFQRELSEEALAPVLENIMVSGASRGGVDVNSAPQSWLARLPGMTDVTAAAIDTARRKQLFTSRETILELEGWTSESEGRQALPFLRVFGSEETLDGTLIHPGDYAIARKLATTLGIELPPAFPPGYEAPDYSSASSTAAAEVKPMEVVQKESKPVVEEFTASGEKSPEFSIQDDAKPETEEPATEAVADSAASDSQAPASEPATEPPAAETPGVEAAEVAAAEVAAAETPAAETAEAEPEPAAATTKTAPVAADPIKHPLPEKAAVDKCIKEWQIGAQRTYQLVHWLCDPFGDSDVSGTPPAVLTKVPAMKDLKKGDQVIGVVVGVMPFGVFVELAPDCSGLVHVSRVSDTFVEDLHEAVQVGDVVTAWVTGIDEKKRRVGLSALSPEREAELEQARRNQRSGGHGHGGGNRGGQNRGGQNRGGQSRDGQTGGGPSKGGQNRGGSPGGRGGAGRSGGKPGGGNRGGQGRDSRGGRGREKRVESYRVVSKKEEKPLTDKMAKGEEPLRSFGDLAQFLGTGKPAAPKKKSAKPKPPAAAKPATSETETAPSEAATASSEAPASTPPANEQAPETQQVPVAEKAPAPAAEPAPAAQQEANEDSSKS